MKKLTLVSLLIVVVLSGCKTQLQPQHSCPAYSQNITIDGEVVNDSDQLKMKL